MAERPFVCLSHRSTAEATCGGGLLLSAPPAEDIDRWQAPEPSSNGTAAQRHMRAVPRCQPTDDAGHRPAVLYVAVMQWKSAT